MVDVCLSEPFQRTFEPLTKFEPYTFKVKLGPLAATEDGPREIIVGLGLAVMKNNRESVTPPPGAGLKTVTSALPTAPISLGGM
jgi:hypothetical protein